MPIKSGGFTVVVILWLNINNLCDAAVVCVVAAVMDVISSDCLQKHLSEPQLWKWHMTQNFSIYLVHPSYLLHNVAQKVTQKCPLCNLYKYLWLKHSRRLMMWWCPQAGNFVPWPMLIYCNLLASHTYYVTLCALCLSKWPVFCSQKSPIHSEVTQWLMTQIGIKLSYWLCKSQNPLDLWHSQDRWLQKERIKARRQRAWWL